MSNPAPRVSIGLPVYNGQSYLAEAIDSLLAQTFEDFELIISDNASTDRTELICRSYAACDTRIRYCRQPENRGAMWNFNYVSRLARGEYFKWAAYDDLHGPTFLQRCVEVLDRDPSVAWCHTRFVHIDSEGQRLPGREGRVISYATVNSGEAEAGGGPGCSQHPPTRTRRSPHPHQRFGAVLLGPDGCLDVFGLIRAEVMRRASPWLPYYGSEKVFVAELSLLGRFEEVPATCFFVRVHPEGSGCLGSVAQQQAFADPKKRPTFQRVQLLRGYARAVRRADLRIDQRARCYAVLLRYLLQVHKWRRVLIRTLTGAGMGGGYRHLVEPDDRPGPTSRVPNGTPQTSEGSPRKQELQLAHRSSDTES